MKTVSLGRLGKKLKRELTRNPKKAAVLGLLCLVAIYFWGPLVWSWMPGKSSAKTKPKTANKAKATSKPPRRPIAVSEANKPTTITKQTFQWNDFVSWLESDERMTSVRLAADSRDPFQAAAVTQQTATDNQATGANGPDRNGQRHYKPEEVGLVLQGVIIGPRYSAATINGHNFRTGANVGAEAAKEKSSAAGRIEFVLQKIHPRYVVLQRAGKTYSLKLKSTKLAGSDRLKYQKPSSNNP